MPLTFAPVPPPLHMDDSGTVRVAGSRVTLDTLIHCYQAGDSPSEIAEDFPTIALADIYAVISYYLHNRAEVDEYLERRAVEAAEIRRKWEESYTFDRKNLKRDLLARLQKKDSDQ